MQAILIKRHKLIHHHKDYILTKGLSSMMYFDEIPPFKDWKKPDMAIASKILKLSSPNFTYSFSITRATFWIRAASLKWILTKLSPLMELENHRCDHNVYTIEAIFINLLELIYKNIHSFCNTILPNHLPLWNHSCGHIFCT